MDPRDRLGELLVRLDATARLLGEGRADKALEGIRLAREYVKELMDNKEWHTRPDKTRALLELFNTVLMTSDSKSRMFNLVTRTWNPVTGCRHNCGYCVTGDTMVLMADLTWKPIKDIEIGDKIIAFTEKSYRGYRYLVKAKVINKIRRRKRKKVYLIKGEHGEVKATEDHLWLVKRLGGGKEREQNVWRRTYQVLKWGHALKFLIAPKTWEKTPDYMAGYIAGIFLGDGSFNVYEYKDKATGRRKKSYFIRLAMKDYEAILRTSIFMKKLNIEINGNIKVHKTKSGELFKIDAWNKKVYEKVLDLIESYPRSLDYKRGFLAGVFDAEGSLSRNLILRISNYDKSISNKIIDYAKELGFEFIREERGVRLKGGFREVLQFLTETQPVVSRKYENIFNATTKIALNEYVEIEYYGKEFVYDITTTSGTFIANGFLSHNCWARRLVETKLREKSRKYREAGFEPAIHGYEFKRGFGGGLVFVSDMGDLWGEWVPREWIERVLDHVSRYRSTLFLFLTKNPARYHEFLDVMPSNVVLGATIETNRDELALGLSRAPPPSERYEAMRSLDWDKKMVAVEPILDFDLEEFVGWIRGIDPVLVYVGYDNYGHRLPEPPRIKTLQLILRLREFTVVVPKTIRRAWHEGGEGESGGQEDER